MTEKKLILITELPLALLYTNGYKLARVYDFKKLVFRAECDEERTVKIFYQEAA